MAKMKLKKITRSECAKLLASLPTDVREKYQHIFDETYDEVLSSCQILAETGHPEYQDQTHAVDTAQTNAENAAFRAIGYSLIH